MRPHAAETQELPSQEGRTLEQEDEQDVDGRQADLRPHQTQRTLKELYMAASDLTQRTRAQR